MEVVAEHRPLYVLSEKPVTSALAGKPDAVFAILQLKARSSVSLLTSASSKIATSGSL
jgi:hypothetical protein